MNPEPPAERDWDDDVVFRTLAAPGLEEDDLIAAKSGGTLWGAGRPASNPPDPLFVLDREAERRRRHQTVLARWDADGALAIQGGVRQRP